MTTLDPAAFGVRADYDPERGTWQTDNAPLLQACVHASGDPAASEACRIYLPKGHYYLGATLIVDRPVILFGDGRGTVLHVPSGVGGVAVVRGNQKLASDGGWGDGAQVRDLTLVALGIAQYAKWQPGKQYAVGDVIVPTHHNGFGYACVQAGVSGMVEPTSYYDKLGTTPPGWHDTVGQLVTDGNVVWSPFELAHGVRLFAQARVENVVARNFGGDGFVASSHTAIDDVEANCNGFELVDCVAQACGAGFVARGADANYGRATRCRALDCRAFGVFDRSFLGCAWDVLVEGGASEGAFYVDKYGSTRSLFLGCYSEIGTGPARIMFPSIYIGGVPGAGFTPESNGLRIVDNALVGLGAFPVSAPGGKQAGVFVGGLAALTLTNPDEPSLPLRQKYGAWSAAGYAGVWMWDWANTIVQYVGPWIAGGHATVGGRPMRPLDVGFPQGFHLGTMRVVSGTGPPTTGAWVQGDRMLNSAPKPGDVEGWACVASGDFATQAPPVFKPFGQIGV